WVSGLYSQFLPGQGGNLMRAAYLNRVHGLGLTRFFLTLVFFGACAMATIGASGVATALGSTIAARPALPGLSVFFASLGAVGLAVLLAPRLVERIAQARGWAADWAGSWRRLTRAEVIVRMALAIAAILALSGARIWIACSALGIRLGFWETAQASVAMLAVALAGFTPGNLGVREAALAAVLAPGGHPEAPLVLAALLDRVALWAAIIPAGLVLQWVLLREPGARQLLPEK